MAASSSTLKAAQGSPPLASASALSKLSLQHPHCFASSLFLRYFLSCLGLLKPLPLLQIFRYRLSDRWLASKLLCLTIQLRPSSFQILQNGDGLAPVLVRNLFGSVQCSLCLHVLLP